MSPVLLARDEPWTEADLEGLDENFRYEIVDGRLLVSPRPANRHAWIVARLVEKLRLVVPAGFDVWVEPMLTLPNSSRSPDVVVVRLADVDLHGMSIGPEHVHLAIEVESPSSVGDDRIRKPAEYASAGIPAYWQVDSEALITVSLLDPGSITYRTVSGPSSRGELPYPVDLSE